MRSIAGVAISRFQHTAARRRLVSKLSFIPGGKDVSTHSRPKAAGATVTKVRIMLIVSTHSRPKAAGSRAYGLVTQGASFNTQPPEGGWTSF